MNNTRIKNSVGIWAFGPKCYTFCTWRLSSGDAKRRYGGTHTACCFWISRPGRWTRIPLSGEINEENVEAIQSALGPMDIYCSPLALHTDATYKLGALSIPIQHYAQRGIETLKRGVDLSAALGAHFIIWPGAEGYNYNFQRDYIQTWDWFVSGIGEIVAYAASKGVTIFLEHKNSEPAMNILMRNISATLYTIDRVRRLGVDTSRLLVNMDWQHLIMNGENLAEYAALLYSEGKTWASTCELRVGNV